MKTVRLIGRDAAIESVTASVKDPGRNGCLIVGETGMGKTAVARAAAELLAAKRSIFHLSGTPALSKMAFAVLAPFLGNMKDSAHPHQEGVFRALCGFLRGQGTDTSGKPILIVDDAHDIDPESRTVLARLVAGDVAQVIILLPRSSMPMEFMELWTDGFLTRCDLAPLNLDEVHLLCEDVLQGKVLRSVSSVLWTMTQGNPMFAVALLRQGRADGMLFDRNGVWLPAGIPSPGLPFCERVAADVRRRLPDEFGILEAVALAEPLPLAALTRPGTEHLVDGLESLELITVTNDSRGLVHLANPLYAEALRRTIPPGRSFELRQTYGEPTSAVPADRLVREVAWALDSGETPADAVLARAADAGNQEFDFAFTLRAAAALQGCAQREEMLLQTAITHAHLEHRLVARDRLEHLLSESENVPILLRSVVWICQMTLRGGDPGQQRRLNVMLARTAERIAGLRTGGAEDRAIDTITDLIRLLHHIADGNPTETEEALDSLSREQPGADPRTRVVSLALLGNLLNASGRFTAGRNATSAALELAKADAALLRLESEDAFLQHVTGLLLSGEWNEAAVQLADYRRHGSRNLIYSGAALQLLEGSLALGQGRAHAALDQLTSAVEGLRAGRHTEFLPYGLGITAYAAALCGQPDLVDELLESFPQESSSSTRGLYLLGEAYGIAASATVGRRDDGARQLLELADQAMAAGLLTAERDALLLATRMGDGDAAGRLAELSAAMDGPFSGALQLQAAALAGRNPSALLAAAAQARTHGFQLVAVGSVEQAVALLKSEEDRPRHNEAQVLLRQYRAQLDGPIVVNSHASAQAARLTSREQDILELAQAGQSNREIARTLSLSVRTVEGHVYRIFTKLGVNSRAELLDAGSWPRLTRV